MNIPQRPQPLHVATPVVPFVVLPKLHSQPQVVIMEAKAIIQAPPLGLSVSAVVMLAWELLLAWTPYNNSILLKAENLRCLPLQFLKFRTRDPFNMWKKSAVLSWHYFFSFLMPSIGLGCSEMRILTTQSSKQRSNNKLNFEL